jgi:hypothetical protein
MPADAGISRGMTKYYLALEKGSHSRRNLVLALEYYQIAKEGDDPDVQSYFEKISQGINSSNMIFNKFFLLQFQFFYFPS